MRRLISWLLTLIVVAALAYTGYVGYEGSRQLVEASTDPADCRTPDLQLGWAYEAINYDISEDAALKSANADMTRCTEQGTPAGDAVVTDDGIRIAGWYIPAGDGSGPTAPTVVLVHGFNNTKANILPYGEGLHEHFNLVAFDMRNRGRSTGTQTTAGVLEQKDLRAIIDWVEREKHPAHLGVLGNSLGAATAMAEARDDARVEALALDSMHTRFVYQIEARLQHGGHPAYPGTWAIFLGIRIRTGVDVGSIDAADEIGSFAGRPILLSHGTGDTEDLPARTQAFYDDAVAAGVTIELHWCQGAGHNAPAGMPVVVCHDDFGAWMRDFFTGNLAAA
ncbi:MAG TPA: alpha/beta hydrolase [Methylomirabilota bacterium]|nr:alpha/beta hydrolase [Methylomirabilota bacterium]